MAQGEILAAHVASGKWRELSTLKRYLDISVELLKEAGRPFTSGANNSIAGSATISDSILWDNVDVGAGARVSRAVLGDHVKIEAKQTVEDGSGVLRSL